MWRDYHNTEYAVEGGVLYLKVAYPETAFAPPRGPEVGIEHYMRIIECCSRLKSPTIIRSVSGAVLEDLLEMFPRAKARTDRAWSDYLYNSSDLIHLPGRKFSGQRNHINRFMREHAEWSFEPITEDNRTDAVVFIEKHAEENKKDSLEYLVGVEKALEVLNNTEKYNQLGGILYVCGLAVGVTLGEIVDDTLFVHTEKADTTYHGSYPMLMNQFAARYATEDVLYINREEDDGVEGLRVSKMSYHPVDLLDKYKVEIF